MFEDNFLTFSGALKMAMGAAIFFYKSYKKDRKQKLYVYLITNLLKPKFVTFNKGSVL